MSSTFSAWLTKMITILRYMRKRDWNLSRSLSRVAVQYVQGTDWKRNLQHLDSVSTFEIAPSRSNSTALHASCATYKSLAQKLRS